MLSEAKEGAKEVAISDLLYSARGRGHVRLYNDGLPIGWAICMWPGRANYHEWILEVLWQVELAVPRPRCLHEFIRLHGIPSFLMCCLEK